MKLNGEKLESRQMLSASTELVSDAITKRLPVDYAPFDGGYVFAGRDAAGDIELWRTDGTDGGTHRVSDIDAAGSSSPHSFFADPETGLVYFYASARRSVTVNDVSFTADERFWVTDGTEVGTKPVEEDVFQTARQRATNQRVDVPKFRWSNSGLLTRASDSWISVSDQITAPRPDLSNNSSTLVATDDKLFFVIEGVLWQSDGTTGGTREVDSALGLDVLPNLWGGTSGDSAYPLLPLGNRIYFSAWNFSESREGIYWSDGQQVEGIELPEGAKSAHLISTNEMHVYFSTLYDGDRWKLWRMTADDSVDEVLDIPSDFSAYPGELTIAELGDALFLQFVDWSSETRQDELWVSNRATLVRLATSPGIEMVPATGQLFFRTNSREGQTLPGEKQLWRSDGTTEGTYQIFKDTGLTHYRHNWHEVLGNNLLFVQTYVWEKGTEWHSDVLWTTDGTVEGTKRLLESEFDGCKGENEIEACGRIDMIDRTSQRATLFINDELWSTDGTVEGTTKVRGGIPYNSSYSFWSPEETAVAGNTVFFPDRLNPSDELWCSDGTAEGTATVKLPDGAVPPKYMRAFNGDVYFLEDSESRASAKLYRIPGTCGALLPGDADGNGTVDFSDFLILSGNFGRQADATFADGDFNADQKVDFADFLILSQNFGATREAATDGA